MNDFISDLQDALPEGRARLALGAVLSKYAGTTIYLRIDSKRERRIRAAENMLRNGMAPAEATAALRERFQMSERTAQRDVSAARKMSTLNGVDKRSNDR